jgi:hypothetical protein
MVEFMATEFRRYPAITPVFTSHLDRFHVTKSAHTALKTSYKVLKTQVGVLDDLVKRLQGSRETTVAPDVVTLLHHDPIWVDPLLLMLDHPPNPIFLACCYLQRLQSGLVILFP